MSAFTTEQRTEIATIVAEALAQVLHNNQPKVSTPKVTTIPLPFEVKTVETVEDIKLLDTIVFEELSAVFGNDASERIVSSLQFCRTCKSSGWRTLSDFRHFNQVYHWVRSNSTRQDYVIFRKLLQTVSAIYRFKFNNGGQANSYYNSIRSQVNLDIQCPHCGGPADKLVARLIEAKLWK